MAESCPVWSENVSRWGRLIGWDIEVMLQGGVHFTMCDETLLCRVNIL